MHAVFLKYLGGATFSGGASTPIKISIGAFDVTVVNTGSLESWPDHFISVTALTDWKL